jgi:hypothetical protein
MILLILFGNLPMSYPFRRARGGTKIFSLPTSTLAVSFPLPPLLRSGIEYFISRLFTAVAKLFKKVIKYPMYWQ